MGVTGTRAYLAALVDTIHGWRSARQVIATVNGGTAGLQCDGLGRPAVVGQARRVEQWIGGGTHAT